MSDKKAKTQELIATFRELANAASDAGIAMHYREIANAWDKARKYLGTDAAEQQKTKEFRELPKEEQTKIENSGSLGEYGFYHHATKPETKHALEIMMVSTAREIVKYNPDFKDAIPNNQHDKDWLVRRINGEKNLDSIYYKNLQSPEFVENILATFPDGRITREKIEQVLTPFEALHV